MSSRAVFSADRTLKRFGMAGLTLTFVAHFFCFSLCGSGPSASVDPHAGCHQSASTGAVNGAASSVTSPDGNCCSGMDSQTLAELSSRDSFATPLSAVSSIASFATLTGQITALGRAAAAAERAPSPPRSPILRI